MNEGLLKLNVQVCSCDDFEKLPRNLTKLMREVNISYHKLRQRRPELPPVWSFRDHINEEIKRGKVKNLK